MLVKYMSGTLKGSFKKQIFRYLGYHLFHLYQCVTFVKHDTNARTMAVQFLLISFLFSIFFAALWLLWLWRQFQGV